MSRVPDGKKYRRSIVWMRRALRVRDNGPLWQAMQEASEVVPLLCLRSGETFLAETPRRRYIRSAIADLDRNLRSLGSAIAVRVGDPAREIPAAAIEFGADAVYAASVYDPASCRRDGTIACDLEKAGIRLHLIKDCVLFEGKEVLSDSGNPYKVFTPYKRAFLAHAQEVPRPFPRLVRLVTPAFDGKALSLDGMKGFVHEGVGGETAALRRMHRFIARRVAVYGRERDLLGKDGTSKLSAPLSHGAISIRTLYWEALAAREDADETARKSIDLFIGELIWREFYYQILSNFPYVAEGPFRTEFGKIPWRKSRSRYEAWVTGQTGYPVVDAAMRQLAAEGWMHNRARMIVASFLTKDLHLNWQDGEQYFARILADTDIASNNGGWQWTAGTGTDASPWFRVFNPVLQGKKFDPDGSYVRAYVPELRSLHARFIHTPWRMSAEDQRSVKCVLGKNYPNPIVNHDVERVVTLGLYRRSGKGSARKQTGH